jgi:predicted glycogen debranching enzyme
MTSPLAISVGPQVCTLPDGAQREWLVPDGLGGYAMGSVSGLRTRRYHGLLMVAVGAPATRRLALASLDPVLVLASGTRIRLGVHAWTSGAIDPRGDQLLESFTLSDGLPTWRWRVGPVVLERTVAMEHGRASVAVVHRLLAGGPVTLELDALGTWRDAHGVRTAGDFDSEVVADGAVLEKAWRIAGPGFAAGGEWYRGVHLPAEADRGLPADEDLWYVGRFGATLAVGESLGISAWAADLATRPADPGSVVAAAKARAQAIVVAAQPADDVDATLALAADAFVVAGPDVVAGYPWFGTWSRDTMTSYEGLFLETGRSVEGAALLKRYAATLSEGMLANTADTGQTEYNTVDATPWFVHAVGRHVARTGDHDLAAELLPALDAVVAAHVAGTRYGIRVDADGLLMEGAESLALTWMDARVEGTPVTPRMGKPVEVNALWINALGTVRELHALIGQPTDDALESRARASFARRFPCEGGGLFDVVDGPSGDDASLRPNQLLAASLPHGPLADLEGASRVLDAVGELLTPLGLCSLAPGSPGYLGLHRGGPAQRDAAYHQGTVWPWLAGPWVEVTLRAGRDAAQVLAGLEAHLSEWGLGSVSETADGDAPHGATGCPFQAWSVAELLRARRLVRGSSRGSRQP